MSATCGGSSSSLTAASTSNVDKWDVEGVLQIARINTIEPAECQFVHETSKIKCRRDNACAKPERPALVAARDALASMEPEDVQVEDFMPLTIGTLCAGHRSYDRRLRYARIYWERLQAWIAKQRNVDELEEEERQKRRPSGRTSSSLGVDDPKDSDVPSEPSDELLETPLAHILDLKGGYSYEMSYYIEYARSWQTVLAVEDYIPEDLIHHLQPPIIAPGLTSLPHVTQDQILKFLRGLATQTVCSDFDSKDPPPEKKIEHARAVLKCEAYRWGPWYDGLIEGLSEAQLMKTRPGVVELVANVRACLYELDRTLRAKERSLAEERKTLAAQSSKRLLM